VISYQYLFLFIIFVNCHSISNFPLLHLTSVCDEISCRLSLSWSTDVPGNHEVVPVVGANGPRATVALAVSLGLNLCPNVSDRDGA
jgi:hypothetical protein